MGYSRGHSGGTFVRTVGVFGCVALWACRDATPEQSDDNVQPPAVVGAYSDLVHANYEDAVKRALELQAAVGGFLQAPTARGLDAARQAWRAAREPYQQTEAFRFYGGPIDEVEGRLNAWPIDEAYIDYVRGDSAAGIINQREVELVAAHLIRVNAQDSEKNVATGFHAIEFLLWGQDHNDAGAGDRPHTDFVVHTMHADRNGERRRTYLRVAVELLVDDLRTVAAEWHPHRHNYRAFFETSAGDAVKRILTGLIVLSGFEVGGERLQGALDSGDQEDEHSCFSDDTHRDMLYDVRGLQNVLRGRYQRIDGSIVQGTSIVQLVEERDPGLARELLRGIDESVTLAMTLKAPFDREIRFDNTSGRDRVRALAMSLRREQKLLERALSVLGVDAGQCHDMRAEGPC